MQQLLRGIKSSHYFRKMDLLALTETVKQQFIDTSILERIAVTFSVTQVLLSYRNKVWLYPAGIISCSLFIILMYNAGLYAECLLNIYYLAMSMYGWYKWVKPAQNNSQNTALSISKSTTKDWKVVLLICLSAFILFVFTLSQYTDSTVPILDSFVSATAWAGMWLLTKRKIENWILLNISNAVAIPLLFYKGLPLTALLTAFLFTVAVFGYFRWKRIYENKGQPNITH